MKSVNKFEHKSKSIISVKSFVQRQFVFLLYAFAIISFSLLIGMLGYHYLGKLSWIDSLLNASMILTGMGPVNILTTDSAKLFASFYSLYSGVVFLTTIAMLLAPAVHRIMHILHIENYED
ncbi:MAG: hypothetical protein ACO3EE_06085 [Flavobacteriales bacterium]